MSGHGATLRRERPAPESTRRCSSPAIAALEQTLAGAATPRPAWVERLLTDIARGGPLVEDDDDRDARRYTFVARADDASGMLVWINKVVTGVDDARMRRLPATDLWHATFRLPADWRGSYGFVADRGVEHVIGAEGEPAGAPATIRWLREHALPDPENPDEQRGHGGHRWLVAQGPAAPAEPWRTTGTDVARDASGAVRAVMQDRGRLEGLGPAVAVRGPGGRRVWVSLPARDVAGDSARDTAHPLVIVLDGQLWAVTDQLRGQASRLAAAGAIVPPVIVQVDCGDPERRQRDLAADGALAEWLADELVPWAHHHLPVSTAARDTVVTGESLGGLTALRCVLGHSPAFGAAIAQSSSLWQDDLAEAAHGCVGDAVRVELRVGSFEPLLLTAHHRLRDALERRGVDVGYREFTGGHDAACWRGEWPRALRRLLGPTEPACVAG